MCRVGKAKRAHRSSPNDRYCPKQKYRDGWEAKFRQRFETEIIQNKDTHFFVGTVHQHPGSWIIIGLFYPSKQAPDLFLAAN